MATLADAKAAWLQQYGYSGSISDMEYQYYSSPPVLSSYGFVRVASPPPAGNIAPILTYGHYMRVVEGGTFSKIRMSMGASSGNICVAAYKNTGSGLIALPGNRIATTGAIPCPATVGIIDIPMGSSVTVAAGDWLYFSADNIAASFAGMPGIGATHPVPATFAGESGAYPAPAVANPGPQSTANYRMFSMVGVP